MKRSRFTDDQIIDCGEAAEAGRGQEAGAEPPERAGTGEGAWQRGRSLPLAGQDRTSFYEWKLRFQTQGFQRLKDLHQIHWSGRRGQVTIYQICLKPRFQESQLLKPVGV